MHHQFQTSAPANVPAKMQVIHGQQMDRQNSYKINSAIQNIPDVWTMAAETRSKHTTIIVLQY